MSRHKLRRYLAELVSEVEQKGYDHWTKQAFPVTYEDVFQGTVLQIEIDVLEATPDYMHLVLMVSNGWVSQYFPVHTSVVVRRARSG